MPNFETTESRKPQKFTVHEASDGIRISPGPYIGVVKSNVDRKRSGRLQVYIPEMGGDPADESAWKSADYCPPFYGVTPPIDERNGQGFQGSPHSYGMWFVPPDIGVSVMVVFVNGDPARGYWFACVPDWPSMHMVPGISAHVTAGAGTPPVVEWNDREAEPNEHKDFYKKQTTEHDVQKKIYEDQGILKDPYRSAGVSSAFRESPSRVFGISTPGRPVDKMPVQKKYNSNRETIKTFYKARKGGHAIIMDDGDIEGKNTLLKFRSGAGHTILMNDVQDKEFIYIVNHNGKAWLEMDREGNVFVYSEQDIRMTAKRDMFLDVGRSFRLKADSIDMESRKYIRSESNQITSLSHQNTKITAEEGLHLKAGKIWQTSDDFINIYGKGNIVIVGEYVLINSGGEQEAERAIEAKKPIKMPAHEPWPYHISNSGNGGDYSVDPNEGFEAQNTSTSVAPNPYSSQSNYGSAPISSGSGSSAASEWTPI